MSDSQHFLILPHQLFAKKYLNKRYNPFGILNVHIDIQNPRYIYVVWVFYMGHLKSQTG